jgi:hypothetical protein
MAMYGLGIRVDLTPIPADAKDTEYLPAGPITVGVEERRLNADVIAETRTPEQQAYIEENIGAATDFDDEGLSIHVFDSESMFEHLRFDLFANDPHYHYMYRKHLLLIPFDEAAHGEMFEWTMRCLEDRLPAMLRYAEAPDLADVVDPAAMRKVTDELRRRFAPSDGRLTSASLQK